MLKVKEKVISTQPIVEPKPIKVWTAKDTQRLIYLATIIAIAITLKMGSGSFTLPFGRVSIVYIPYHLAGIIFGPVAGFITGVMADLTGYISGTVPGQFNPLITLTNGLYGFSMGLIFKHVKLKMEWRTIIGGAVSAFIISLAWGSYANFAIGTSAINSVGAYLAKLNARIPQALFVFAQTFALMPLIRALNLSVFKTRRIK